MGWGNTLWTARLLLLKQAISVALSVSFVLAPLGAYAQESGSDTPPVDLGTGSGSEPTVEPTVQPPAPEPPSSFDNPGVDMQTPSPEPSPATSPPADSGTTESSGTTDSGAETPTPLALGRSNDSEELRRCCVIGRLKFLLARYELGVEVVLNGVLVDGDAVAAPAHMGGV